MYILRRRRVARRVDTYGSVSGLAGTLIVTVLGLIEIERESLIEPTPR